MPRKKVSKKNEKPALLCSVPTMKQLGKELNVHANSLTAWKKRGAPSGPPYSLIEWYLWAKANGYECDLPRDPTLQAMLMIASAPAQRSDNELLLHIGEQIGSIKIEALIDPGERALAMQRLTGAIRNYDEVKKNRRHWVPVRTVKQFISVISNVVMEQMQNFDLVVDVIPRKESKLRKAMRERIDDQRNAMREELGKEGAKAVRQMITAGQDK